MNRRGFLSSIAAALVLDPERALWVPGKKLISVPAPRERHVQRMHLRQGQNFMPQAIVIHEGRAEDCARCTPPGPYRGNPRVGERFTIAAVNVINPPR